MKVETLSLTLKGSEDDGGDVVLSDLRDFVAAVTTCLKRVEKKFENGPRLDYRIIGLRRSSAVLKIAPVTKNPDTSHGPLVLGLFAKTVKDLESGKKPDSRITSGDLLEFKKLLAPTKNKASSVGIGKTKLTDRYTSNIDRLLESAVISLGSAKGTIERLNLHKKNEFTLYPAIGEPINCHFKDALFEKIRSALKRSVTVFGRMHRFFGNPFPEKASVEDLEVHPYDDDLPKLSEMGGAFADNTVGSKGSVAFVRKIRDTKNGD
jgi:hypothetical protein